MTQKDNTLRIAPLLDRVSEYIHNCQMDSEQSPTMKFRGWMLLAELYERIHSLSQERDKHLGRYFGDNTLRVDLESVVLVERVQQELSQLHIISNSSCEDYFQTIKLIYHNGLDTSLPPLKESKLWRGNENTTSAALRYSNVFHKAQESLEEPEKEFNIAQLKAQASPDNKGSIPLLQEKLLKNQYVHRAKDVQKPSECFDFMQSILSIQRQLVSVSCQEIFSEIARALEMLRQVFMTDAQDIYYIRTGETDAITNDTNRDIINECYTEIPLRDYFNEREEAREGLLIQMDTEIEEWRIQNKRTGKPLLRNEHLKYLQQQLEEVFASMQQDYPDLWKLREHSGGLDSEVTVDNFARMFYKRANVDHEFLELQWKAELLSELIAEDEKKKAREPINYSPEESAVNQFVDNIMKIANMFYDEYEGKTVSLGSHMPDEKIHIQVLELQRYLDKQREENYEDFRSYCFPQNSKSNQRFCQYVMILKEEGFFSRLPNNLMAPVVAAVIGREATTITNYLSKKFD